MSNLLEALFSALVDIFGRRRLCQRIIYRVPGAVVRCEQPPFTGCASGLCHEHCSHLCGPNDGDDDDGDEDEIESKPDVAEAKEKAVMQTKWVN